VAASRPPLMLLDIDRPDEVVSFILKATGLSEGRP